VPGGTDYWEAFVKRRKEVLAKKKMAKLKE
jgi:hypothetical protein